MLRIQNEIHLAAAFEGKPVWDYSEEFTARSGLRFLNFPGLLNFLEVSLGISSFMPEDQKRLISYWNACQKVCDKKEFSGFLEAFMNDGLTVAEKLLKWRDFLVLSGWSSEIELFHGAPIVLKILALVEPEFRKNKMAFGGEADHWQQLLEKVCGLEFELPASLQKQKLICYDPADTICPTYLKILQALTKAGMQIEFRSASASAINPESNLRRVQDFLLSGNNTTTGNPLREGDDSFSLIDFQEYAGEAQHLATMANSEKPVVILADYDEFLRSTLMRHGHSSSFSVKVWHPGGTQFLRCAGKIVFGPFWKDNISSFLKNSPCPVPRKLANQLLNHMGRKGDFGQAWDAIIDSWFKDRGLAGETIWNGLNEIEIRRFLPYGNKPEERTQVPVSELQEYFALVVRWAEGSSKLPETIALFSGIKQAALRMTGFLELWGGQDISFIRFEKAAQRLLSAVTLENGDKEAQSLYVVQHPGTVLGRVHTLYWTSFAANHKVNSIYQEISPEVHRTLDEIPNLDYYPETPATIRKREWYQWVRCIAQVTERCCLIAPRFLVEENGVHPLQPELLKLKGLKHRKPLSLQEEFEAITGNPGPDSLFGLFELPGLWFPRREYFPLKGFSEWLDKTISTSDSGYRLINYESYSGLDKLIQHPMEWLMKKLKGFSTDNPDDFSNTSLAEGNAFHRFAELVFGQKEQNREGLDLKPFKPVEKEQWEFLINQSVLEKGSILLLPKNRLEYSKFRKEAMDAMDCLCSFIYINGFTRIGIENSFRMELPEEYPLAGLTGKIDMMLAKAAPDGSEKDVVIIDLKWSGNQKKYEKLISENDAVQLAVYAQVVPQAQWLGYLLLPDMRLFGANSEELKMPQGMEIADPELVFNQGRAQNVQQKLWESLRFRLKEIADGNLETGDDFQVNSLNYGIAQNVKMISLDASQSIKYASYSDRLAVLKVEQTQNQETNEE